MLTIPTMGTNMPELFFQMKVALRVAVISHPAKELDLSNGYFCCRLFAQNCTSSKCTMYFGYTYSSF